MSYILDALRKSEDERRVKQPLALPESGSDLTYRRNNRAPWLLVALVIAGAAILYMVAKGWGPGYSEPEPAIAKVEPDPAVQRVEQDKPHVVAGHHRIPKSATDASGSPEPQTDADPKVISDAPTPKGTSTPLPRTAVQQVAQDKPRVVAGHPIPKSATTANSSIGPQSDAEPEEIAREPKPTGTSAPLRQTAPPEQSSQHTGVVEKSAPEEPKSTHETARTLSPSPPKQAFVDAVRAQTEPSRSRARPRTETPVRATVSKRLKVQPRPKSRPTQPAKSTPTVVAVAEPVTPSAPTGSEPDPLPLLTAMPHKFQRGMPEMNVNVHFYSEDPGSRFVVINMTKYRQGERIADGPLLKAITPDGLILQSGQTRFRMGRR